MNATKPAPRSVAGYIEVFYDAIGWGQMSGLPGDWNGLRRRLDVLSQKVRDREADGITPTARAGHTASSTKF